MSKIKRYNSIVFLGIPLTSKTKNKTGFYFHHFIDNQQTKQVALLGQIRIFDCKRKLELFGSISDIDFKTIKDKIKNNIVN